MDYVNDFSSTAPSHDVNRNSLRAFSKCVLPGKYRWISPITRVSYSPCTRVYGGCSSMVEPQIVILVVAGSSPVIHPSFEALTRSAA